MSSRRLVMNLQNWLYLGSEMGSLVLYSDCCKCPNWCTVSAHSAFSRGRGVLQLVRRPHGYTPCGRPFKSTEVNRKGLINSGVVSQPKVPSMMADVSKSASPLQYVYNRGLYGGHAT